MNSGIRRIILAPAYPFGGEGCAARGAAASHHVSLHAARHDAPAGFDRDPVAIEVVQTKPSFGVSDASLNPKFALTGIP
jgi:hypothetical protein